MATIVASPYGPINIDTTEAEAMSEGVAIFNPAIKGTDEGGNPIVVLAMVGYELLVIDAEGYMKQTIAGRIRADWRYDIGKEQWVDTSGISLEGETQ